MLDLLLRLPSRGDIASDTHKPDDLAGAFPQRNFGHGMPARLVLVIDRLALLVDHDLATDHGLVVGQILGGKVWREDIGHCLADELLWALPPGEAGVGVVDKEEARVKILYTD